MANKLSKRGHKIWTVEELDEMTPEEQQALFDARVPLDISEFPEDAVRNAQAAVLKAVKEAGLLDSDPS